MGFIPDGNRRWAVAHGLPKEAGYAYGLAPWLILYDRCKDYGIKEVSIYCFTQDNTKRASVQKQAFSSACVTFALEVARRGAALLVVGDETSTQFPDALKGFRRLRSRPRMVQKARPNARRLTRDVQPFLSGALPVMNR